MMEWYYAREGQQFGPVAFEKLGELARDGNLDATKDLVWHASMAEWTPAGQVPGIFVTPASPATADTDFSKPDAPPSISSLSPTHPAETDLSEIVPGSDPLDVVACIKRGFEIAKRNVGILVLVGLVYFVISMALGAIQGVVETSVGINQVTYQDGADGSPTNVHIDSVSSAGWAIYAITTIVSQVFSLFMGLGLTRIGLNLVSGKAASVGMLFGEGSKLLRAIGATILFTIMLMVGFLLLIIPGVYLALRYGQFMMAIVDRDLGIMDAFAYSSSITTNNRLNIFLLGLLAIPIMLAGLLACGVGILVAAPIIWLSTFVAYRWMQYGQRAAMDQTGTQTPMLASQL